MQQAFDQLAEGLARYVDVAKQLAACIVPAGKPALQQRHIGITERLQALRGHGGKAFAFVIDGDGRIAARYPGVDVQFQPGQGDIGGEQRVSLGERRLFADIDQCHFLAVQQCLAQGGVGAYGNLAHAGELSFGGRSLDKSQKLGMPALE